MTTETLRPDGTVTLAGSITGAATAHAATNDDSDSSYVQLASGGYVDVNLDTFTLPAGAVTKTVRARARVWASTSTSVAVLYMLDAGVVLGSATQFSGIETYPTVDELYGLEIAATLTQAQIDGLRVQVARGVGAASSLRVGEIYAEVLYATQPSVTVTAPTGTVTDTTSPTATWTYTEGTDGGPQSRARVKVFSAAQYGAAGFNPDTSTATYDSGEVLGSSVAHAFTSAIANGTYRCYVKAAQTINAVAHWSEWDYEAFTMDAATPDAPTVATSAQTTTARIKVTVTKAVGDTVPFDLVDVERSDDGGSTWVFVRGATAQQPPGDVFIIYDYEAPFGIPVLYRARSTDQTASGDISGPWGQSSTVTLSPTVAWLKHPTNPALNTEVTIVEIPRLQRGLAQGVNRIIGRADPVVISDTRWTPEGEATFVTLEDAEADTILATLDEVSPLLLQTPAEHGWGSRWVVFADVVEERATRLAVEEARYWRAPFTVVERPTDDGITIGGFTWGDLDDTYTDWQALLDTDLTWGDIYGASV